MDDSHAVLKLLYPYLDGELGEDDRCRVHAHLLGCLTCQDVFDAERSFLHLLRTNPTTQPAPPTAWQIAEFVRRRSSDPEHPAADRTR